MDPDFALYHLRRSLWDPVDPKKLGSLDPQLRYHVNGEPYRFSGPRTLRRFMLAPQRWCGTLRDPVTGERFKPNADTPYVMWLGGPYYFTSDTTKNAFIDDPFRYEVARGM